MLELNKLYLGDCIKVMKGFPDNSIDSIVTDPPYGLGFMGKGWDTFNPEFIAEKMSKDKRPHTKIASQRRSNTAGTYDYSRNKEFQKWFTVIAKECLRVLKPGGHLLSFGGTRTYHRMVCGIEDAGFEIRDCLQWLYGSGFPKNLNIGKQIDKIKGAKREKIWKKYTKNTMAGAYDQRPWLDEARKKGGRMIDINKPITPEAKQWDGWGTGLKPANEPIVLARKPISEKNIAENVLKWETGGIAIDKCRIIQDDDNPMQNNQDCGAFYNELSDIFESFHDFSNDNFSLFLSVVQDFSECIFSVLDSYNNLSKDLLHNLVFSNDNYCIKLLGESYDFDRLVDNVILYVQAEKSIKDFLFDYPKLFYFCDEQSHSFEVFVQDIFPLLDDVRAYISHFPDFLKNNPSYDNNPLLFFLLAFPYLILLQLIKQILHHINTPINIIPNKGRWPANVIFDEETAELLDEQTKNKLHAAGSCSHRNFKGWENSGDLQNENISNDSGGASRFFYVAKASKSERNAGLEGFEENQIKRLSGGKYKDNSGSNNSDKSGANSKNLHPTVKPIKLMRYLVRLITPPNGICLDPFIGSGTNAIACIQEGFDYIGIEKEKEYFDIAEKRIFHYKQQLKLF